jgi:hypothetical protein
MWADQYDVKYYGEGIGIALRKGQGDLKQQLNDAIDTIRANGTYEKIAKKYFDFDLGKGSPISGRVPGPRRATPRFLSMSDYYLAILQGSLLTVGVSLASLRWPRCWAAGRGGQALGSRPLVWLAQSTPPWCAVPSC